MLTMTAGTVDKKKTELVNLIKGNYRFSFVEEDEIGRLLAHVRFRTFPKGSYVFMEGDDVQFMGVVVSGRIEINMNNYRFSEKIFNIVGPGQMLGLSETFNCHGLHISNALCTKDTEVALIGKEPFRKAMWSLPSFSFAVCIYMANMIGELRQELALTGAEAKILTYLKSRIDQSGYRSEGFLCVPREITNEKLSSMLNLTRETVSRTFRGLKEKKILDIHKDHYTILDEEKIRNAVPEYSCVPGYYGREP